MSTGRKFKKVAGVLVLSAAVLCPGVASPMQATTSQTHRKAKKPAPAPLPPLPSGPTGPLQQQVPLDSMAPVPPQVTYQNAQLTIVAPNSTLGDILRAVRKQTGAEIEIPAAPERVVTQLGPGPARTVMAELLNGSRFNYVLLGSPANDALLTRVVLVAKTGPENGNPSDGQSMAGQQQAGMPQPDTAPDANDAEAAADDSTDDAADQAAAEAEQPASAPEQPGVKTPQEMLQEMQQRQMQLQQQQQLPGQPPIPGTVMAPRPPQEQQ
jgi:hypothetical protein